MKLTNDATIITRVWFTFTTSDVFPEIDWESGDFDGTSIDDTRIDRAREFIAGNISETFPNATDIIIHDTGWDGEWAQLAPRAETGDGMTTYEPYLEWMDTVCQSIAN